MDPLTWSIASTGVGVIGGWLSANAERLETIEDLQAAEKTVWKGTQFKLGEQSAENAAALGNTLVQGEQAMGALQSRMGYSGVRGNTPGNVIGHQRSLLDQALAEQVRQSESALEQTKLEATLLTDEYKRKIATLGGAGTGVTGGAKDGQGGPGADVDTPTDVVPGLPPIEPPNIVDPNELEKDALGLQNAANIILEPELAKIVEGPGTETISAEELAASEITNTQEVKVINPGSSVIATAPISSPKLVNGTDYNAKDAADAIIRTQKKAPKKSQGLLQFDAGMESL